MSIADQARKLGVSERDLYRFYRGLGPNPVRSKKPLADVVEVINEDLIEVANEAANSEPSESIEYLGGGWYMLPDGQKVRGLSNPVDSEEE